MIKRIYYFLVILFGSIFFLTACRNKQKITLFTKLSSSESGIHFNNDIKDTDSTYSFINEF